MQKVSMENACSMAPISFTAALASSSRRAVACSLAAWTSSMACSTMALVSSNSTAISTASVTSTVASMDLASATAEAMAPLAVVMIEDTTLNVSAKVWSTSCTNVL